MINIVNIGFINDVLKLDLLKAMLKFDINTPFRAAHFISQCKHESTNFTRVVENLNYSAQGLRSVFPKYFADIDTALHYERKPEKIANRVYASRMGNGDELSGDGWKYRGRGFIQLTGKNNYIAFGNAIGEDMVKIPDFVGLSKYACLSAAWFFSANGCNKMADGTGTDPVKTVQDITKRINGGLNGITERIENYKKTYTLLKQ